MRRSSTRSRASRGSRRRRRRQGNEGFRPMPGSTSSPPRITPRELHAALSAAGEVALLDLREEGDFSQGHILLAASLPLSRLELRAAVLVPRLNTRVVLCDEG